MTDIIQLFSGIGIVIDEEIFKKGDSPNGIQKISQSLKEKHIPLLEYEELPDESVSQFHSVSFIILDWNLSGTRPIPEATINDNVSFISQMKESCYSPIFIFSDEDPHSIEVALSEKGITSQNSPIFIKKKEDLNTADKLFDEITEWVKHTPSIYVLKEWELATRNAKTRMLWDLTAIHSAWPGLLTKAIQDDGGDKSWELTNSLQNNLSYRIVSPEYDNEIINVEKEGVTKEQIRKILECERFIPNNKLPEYPFAGDIYLVENDYYINIRPDCDIIREKKDLYLLKGRVIDENKINTGQEDGISFHQGEFQEKINNCYVAFVEGMILCFSLRKLTIKKWNEIKNNRCGRLLPPFITKIQQKYSAYIQRQGLPSIPNEAI